MRSWIENELPELINWDQFRLSIPIQFQYKTFQFNANSIHAELNWLSIPIQFMNWSEPWFHHVAYYVNDTVDFFGTYF